MQKISFISNMETIIRQSYIDKIEKYLGKETVIVSSDWAHSVSRSEDSLFLPIQAFARFIALRHIL